MRKTALDVTPFRHCPSAAHLGLWPFQAVVRPVLRLVHAARALRLGPRLTAVSTTAEPVDSEERPV